MLIARLKKDTNIVEYIIYMFQIEDILRSVQFDESKLEQYIISQFDQNEEVLNEIRDWYKAIILEMKENGIEQQGHLLSVSRELEGLSILHQTLLIKLEDKRHQENYEAAKPVLNDLIKKAGGKGVSNEIEMAINAVYGLLVLRLRKQNVSSETEEAIAKLSKLLAHLAKQYRELKMGNIQLDVHSLN